MWADFLGGPGPEFYGFNRLTLIIIFGTVLVAIILRFLTMAYSSNLLRRILNSEKLTSEAVQDSDKALGTAVGSVFAYFVIQWMNNDIASDDALFMMPEYAGIILPSIFQFLAASCLVLWAFRFVGIVEILVMKFDDDGSMDGSEKTLISALESILKFIIIFTGGVFIADAVGLDLTSLIAGLGISGLALALAAKDTISNFFGAVTVLLDRPFKVGDWVMIGSVEGTVEEINLRTTIIRTGNDTIITVPNATLVSTPVENFGKRRWRRWMNVMHFDINSNPESVDNFCEKVTELISENSQTTKEDSSYCMIDTISAQSIDVSILVYWDTTSSLEEKKAREQFILEIMQVAKDMKLEFYDSRIRSQR